MARAKAVSTGDTVLARNDKGRTYRSGPPSGGFCRWNNLRRGRLGKARLVGRRQLKPFTLETLAIRIEMIIRSG
jgi:hypothetical protein